MNKNFLIMKKIINTMIIAFIAIITITSCSSVDGNGDYISVEQEVSLFNKISIQSSFDVTLHSDVTPKVVIEAESNILPYIIAEVRNNKLILKSKNNAVFNSTKNIKIAVYSGLDKNGHYYGVTEVHNSGSGLFSAKLIAEENLSLSASGSGNIEIESVNDPIEPCDGCLNSLLPCYKLELYTSGSGKINIGTATCFNCLIDVVGSGNCHVSNFYVWENIDVNINGSGNVKLDGGSSSAKIKIGGSGEYDACNLITNTCDIKTSGSGSACVNVSDTLTAIVNGSGDINFYGNPVLISSGKGTGSIRMCSGGK